MKFLDEAVIFCQSGHGGDGCMSFRREKFIPKGGPDGGNGGRGGSIIFEGTRDLNTLIDFRYTQLYKAKRGGHGMGKNRAGKAADDLVIKVPIGTELIDDESGETLVDITDHGQQVPLLKGGKGGRGNATFVSSINRAPRQTTPGEAGKEIKLRLRLKLLADLGMLGLPNAGKSTFISAVSNAKPKIADYPFTTMQPKLGMVRRFKTDMVMADLPGLIKGASEGHGVGHRFLKHVSRCSVVLHLVDITQENPAEAYQTIRGELEAHDEMYGMGLSELPEIVALSKCDSVTELDMKDVQKAFEEDTGVKPILFSSQSGLGMDDVLDQAREYVEQTRAKRFAEEDAENDSVTMEPQEEMA